MWVSEEPALSFNQAALKIQWAEKLIGNLNEVATSFINRKPYAFEVTPDPDGTSHSIQIGLTEPMHPIIALGAGDICSNLRASLDYAWMGLVRSQGVTGKHTLPIADNRKGLIATIAKSPVKKLASEAERLLVDCIKSHRDVANGGNAGLIALNDLSNWNKHNLLITTLGATAVKFRDDRRNTYRLTVYGDVAPTVTYRNRKPRLSHDSEPAVEVVFGLGMPLEHEPIVPAISNLAKTARQCLQAFCEVFPSAANPWI